MKNNIDELAYKPIGRLLWQYSMPAVTGMLVMSLYNVIDRIYIGRGVGPEAISGLAITFPVMNLSAAMGVLIGAGASARTSIMLGAGQKPLAERVLGNSLVLTLAIASVYTLLFGLFIDDILRAFGASDATLPYARDFMLWILPGLIVTNLCFSFNNIMRASGYPLKAMATMIMGALLNIALAPVFIFWLGLGIKGAAIATDISMLLSAAFVMWHFIKPDSAVHFRRGIYRLDWKIIWGIVTIGAAPSVVNAAACFINMTVNTSLVRYGSDLDVGAAGIFITYTSLLVTFVVGIGMGMQPIVGYNYGAGQLHRLRKAYLIAMGVSTAVCVAGWLCGLVFPEAIARLFTSDAHLIEITANGLRKSMLMFWVVGFQVISTTFFQSIGCAGKSIVLSLSRQVIFLYPLLKVLSHAYGLDGVWYAFPVSDFCATVVTLALVAYQFVKIREATRVAGA